MGYTILMQWQQKSLCKHLAVSKKQLELMILSHMTLWHWLSNGYNTQSLYTVTGFDNSFHIHKAVRAGCDWHVLTFSDYIMFWPHIFHLDGEGLEVAVVLWRVCDSREEVEACCSTTTTTMVHDELWVIICRVVGIPGIDHSWCVDLQATSMHSQQ